MQALIDAQAHGGAPWTAYAQRLLAPESNLFRWPRSGGHDDKVSSEAATGSGTPAKAMPAASPWGTSAVGCTAPPKEQELRIESCSERCVPTPCRPLPAPARRIPPSTPSSPTTGGTEKRSSCLSLSCATSWRERLQGAQGWWSAWWCCAGQRSHRGKGRKGLLAFACTQLQGAAQRSSRYSWRVRRHHSHSAPTPSHPRSAAAARATPRARRHASSSTLLGRASRPQVRSCVHACMRFAVAMHPRKSYCS